MYHHRNKVVRVILCILHYKLWLVSKVLQNCWCKWTKANLKSTWQGTKSSNIQMLLLHWHANVRLKGLQTRHTMPGHGESSDTRTCAFLRWNQKLRDPILGTCWKQLSGPFMASTSHASTVRCPMREQTSWFMLIQKPMRISQCRAMATLGCHVHVCPERYVTVFLSCMWITKTQRNSSVYQENTNHLPNTSTIGIGPKGIWKMLLQTSNPPRSQTVRP